MKNRKILLRFDDICPTMNWEMFEKARRLVEDAGAKPLIGVIPDCRDPELQIDAPRSDFWEYVRKLQADGWTVAMHGCHHVYDSNRRGMVNNGFQSEFAGHPYAVQFEKIKHGREVLLSHGIDTNIFFAPSHSYDENTLKALAANGFRYMSDSCGRKPYLREGICCIPCRSGGCPALKGDGYYTAVFHAHEWVRPDKARGYDELANVCKNHADEIVPFATFLERPCGWAVVQRFDETLFVNWRRNLRPPLSKLYHWLGG